MGETRTGPAPRTAAGVKAAAHEGAPQNESTERPAEGAPDVAALQKELAGMKERQKKVNMAMRKLAHAILAPVDAADSGAGRRNAMAQAVQGLVNELGLNEEQ